MNIITKLAYNALTKTIQAIAPGGAYVPLASSESGRWTPTLTTVANITAKTAYSCIYTRVGKIVTCSGFMSIDPTTAANTATQIRISLPINSTPTLFEDISGALVGGAPSGTAYAAGYFGWVSGSNADVFFNCTDAGNNNYGFTFQYEIK